MYKQYTTLVKCTHLNNKMWLRMYYLFDFITFKDLVTNGCRVKAIRPSSYILSRYRGSHHQWDQSFLGTRVHCTNEINKSFQTWHIVYQNYNFFIPKIIVIFRTDLHKMKIKHRIIGEYAMKRCFFDLKKLTIVTGS